MDPFKSVIFNNFDSILRVHYLIIDTVDRETNSYLKKIYSNELNANEFEDFSLYHQSTNILIQSTFLQLYALLEETLYHESCKKTIKNLSGIKRFKEALAKQGYDTSGNFWKRLEEISKIRKCLLHSNGRLDIDRYRSETESAIEMLNNSANEQVIKTIDLKHHKPGTTIILIQESFLDYSSFIIKSFINSQHPENLI